MVAIVFDFDDIRARLANGFREPKKPSVNLVMPLPGEDVSMPVVVNLDDGYFVCATPPNFGTGEANAAVSNFWSSLGWRNSGCASALGLQEASQGVNNSCASRLYGDQTADRPT